MRGYGGEKTYAKYELAADKDIQIADWDSREIRELMSQIGLTFL